jgi:hypothetical protein
MAYSPAYRLNPEGRLGGGGPHYMSGNFLMHMIQQSLFDHSVCVKIKLRTDFTLIIMPVLAGWINLEKRVLPDE